MRKLLLGIAMLLLVAAHVQADGGDHISVAGTEVVQVKPDMAVLTFSVVKENKSAEEAKKQVDAIVARLLEKFKKLDGKDLKIISNNISINKNRNYQTGEIINYNVSMPFEIELYNLTLLNRVLDDA
ncbi:MAG TPA: SIMPL domain-containing protein, partial [Spongiibacteraceae bacterium]